MIDRLSLRLLLAQAADVATFLVFYLLIDSSVRGERNPLVLGLMALGGVYLVGIVKLGITLLVIWRSRLPMRPSRFARVRRFHDRHPGLVAFHVKARIVGVSAATASGIVGAGFNLGALLATAGLA